MLARGLFLGRVGGLCLASMLRVIQGAAMPKLRLAPAGLAVLIWISGDWEGAISGFNGTLSVCICHSVSLCFKASNISPL